MKRLIFYLSVVLLIGHGAKAQQVVTTAGEFFEGENASLSWTMGELITATFTEGANQLTQGQQQTSFYFTGIDDVLYFSSIQLYPNPTIDYLTIETDETNLTYALSNSIGQIVQNGEISQKSQNIDVSSIADGIYFITLTSKTQSNQSQVFKLIKQ